MAARSISASLQPMVLALPLRVTQGGSRLGTVTQLVALGSMTAALALTTGSIAIAAMVNPEVRDLAIAQPSSGLLAAGGLLGMLGLFAWPALQRMRSLVAARSVEISDGTVTVRERGVLSTSSWSQPLGAFEGLAHVIRTRVSGAEHELVLVHPERWRSVRIATGERFGKSEIEAACAVLGVAEVPARLLYERARSERPAGGLGLGQGAPSVA